MIGTCTRYVIFWLDMARNDVTGYNSLFALKQASRNIREAHEAAGY